MNCSIVLPEDRHQAQSFICIVCQQQVCSNCRKRHWDSGHDDDGQEEMRAWFDWAFQGGVDDRFAHRVLARGGIAVGARAELGGYPWRG